jgi:hypothetical protein
MSFYFINNNNQLLYNSFNIPHIITDSFNDNNIKRNIKYILKYCQLFLYENDTFYEFCIDNEQLNIHKQFIIRKLDYLIRIFEYKIKSEIKEKYKMLENIISVHEFEHILNEEVNNNKYISLSKNTLLEMILYDNEI